MPRALVIGSPITHSLSPVLHTAGYDALRLPGWSYGRAEVTAAELGPFLAELPEEVVGLSVTMPCKEAALALATSTSALAREVGAVNTLVRSGEGWFGDNTDVAGVFHALLDAGCSPEAGMDRAVVLGSGATARSVVAALGELGIRGVTFVTRREPRPETVALARAYDLDVSTLRSDDPDAGYTVAAAPLAVSTVPAGAMADMAVRITESAPRPGQLAFDVVYAGWPTPFARAMASRGAKVVSGLDMLVHQACAQFELFTGCAAPIADMMAAGRAAVKG